MSSKNNPGYIPYWLGGENACFCRLFFFPEKRIIITLITQNVEVTFLASRGFLYVDIPTANYINTLKRVALKSGWVHGTPLIDLTGGSPGATVILGGEIVGAPWLVGKYKGSNEFAKTVLEMVPKSKLQSAWVLTAPKGKRKISSEILLELGLDFPSDYIAVGKTKTGHREEIQVPWKPLAGMRSLSGNYFFNTDKDSQFIPDIMAANFMDHGI